MNWLDRGCGTTGQQGEIKNAEESETSQERRPRIAVNKNLRGGNQNAPNSEQLTCASARCDGARVDDEKRVVVLLSRVGWSLTWSESRPIIFRPHLEIVCVQTLKFCGEFQLGRFLDVIDIEIP